MLASLQGVGELVQGIYVCACLQGVAKPKGVPDGLSRILRSAGRRRLAASHAEDENQQGQEQKGLLKPHTHEGGYGNLFGERFVKVR